MTRAPEERFTLTTKTHTSKSILSSHSLEICHNPVQVKFLDSHQVSKYNRQFGVYSRAAGVTVIKDTEGRPVVIVGVENMLIGKIINIMEATPATIPSGVKITRGVLNRTPWERQEYQDVPVNNETEIGQILPAKGRAFTSLWGKSKAGKEKKTAQGRKEIKTGGRYSNMHAKEINLEMGDVVEVETTLKLSHAGTERCECTGSVQSLLPPVEQADEQVW